MKANAARRLLFPRSHIRLPTASLTNTCHSKTSDVCGHLDLPRSRPCRSECYRAHPFSACLSVSRTRDDVFPAVTEATGCLPFGLGLPAVLAQSS
jgi:hypothetical protein